MCRARRVNIQASCFQSAIGNRASLWRSRSRATSRQKGFVVFAYDPVGQGERLQAYDWRVGRSIGGWGTEQHIQLGAMACWWDRNLRAIRSGMRSGLWIICRLGLRWMATRIGCTGCSGGGTLTTYISALDDRIKVAAPACYMNSFRKLCPGPTGDSEQSWGGFLAVRAGPGGLGRVVRSEAVDDDFHGRRFLHAGGRADRL